eukprot:1156575-Pelagomonas_calceolata.AAC.4
MHTCLAVDSCCAARAACAACAASWACKSGSCAASAVCRLSWASSWALVCSKDAILCVCVCIQKGQIKKACRHLIAKQTAVLPLQSVTKAGPQVKPWFAPGMPSCTQMLGKRDLKESVQTA